LYSCRDFYSQNSIPSQQRGRSSLRIDQQSSSILIFFSLQFFRLVCGDNAKLGVKFSQYPQETGEKRFTFMPFSPVARSDDHLVFDQVHSEKRISSLIQYRRGKKETSPHIFDQIRITESEVVLCHRMHQFPPIFQDKFFTKFHHPRNQPGNPHRIIL